MERRTERRARASTHFDRARQPREPPRRLALGMRLARVLALVALLASAAPLARAGSSTAAPKETTRRDDDAREREAEGVLAMGGPDATRELVAATASPSSSSSSSSSSLPSASALPGASFTCVATSDATRGSCFVATCAQLVGAVRSGVAHVTLYRDLVAPGTFERCGFPITVSRPLTIRGACAGRGGDADADADAASSRCVVDGGGVVTRLDRETCRQHCATCSGGGAPLFDVRAGGALTLIDLELRNACNARDGRGGGGRRSRAGVEPRARRTRAADGRSTPRGAFYTLVPIRPRSRGERRSLRTLPGASLRPPLPFNPRPRRLSTPTDAFELQPDIRL